MSNFVRIYEVREEREEFRVPLPAAQNPLDDHIFGTIVDQEFLRCDCRDGQSCFICQPVQNLRKLEFSSGPVVTVSIADEIRRAMDGENDVSVIEELVAEGKVGECAICMSDIVKGETFRALPCASTVFHKFHSKCIDQWLRSKDTCPVCRAKVLH